MKQDALQMSLLFDYYGELLSEKQRADDETAGLIGRGEVAQGQRYRSEQ